MADTMQQKKQIREVIKILSKQFNTIFTEKNVVNKGDKTLKYHGVSSNNEIAFFVFNSKLIEGRIKSGQHDAIFDKCYLLTLSDCEKKMIVFTDADFHRKFSDIYREYLKDIETMYCPLPQE